MTKFDYVLPEGFTERASAVAGYQYYDETGRICTMYTGGFTNKSGDTTHWLMTANQRRIAVHQIFYYRLGMFESQAEKGGSVGYYFKIGKYVGKEVVARCHGIVHKGNTKMSYLVEILGENIEASIPEEVFNQVIERRLE